MKRTALHIWNLHKQAIWTLSTLLFIYIGVVVISTGSLSAQTVQFAVNTEHVSVQPGDKVLVLGNIPALGNWTDGEGLVLTPSKREPSLFTGKLNMRRSRNNNVILYKYVIQKKDGSLSWEQRGNREIDLLAYKPSKELVWFDDRSTPGITRPVSLDLHLDLSGLHVHGNPIIAVELFGSRDPLHFEESKNGLTLEDAGNNSWFTQVTFPAGTAPDVPFKLRFNTGEEWIWEWRPGHANHVLWLDDKKTSQFVVYLAYNEETGLIEPVGESKMTIDRYVEVIEQLGETISARYQYDLAMLQLESGLTDQALQTYDRYRSNTPGGEEINDFEYTYAAKLAETDVEQALRYIGERQNQETFMDRKAHFEYLKGELLLNAGQHNKARQYLRNVQHQYVDEEDIQAYTRDALIESYLQDTHSDSIRKGVEYLENIIPESSGYRMLLKKKARAYLRAEMPREREQILLELSANGTPNQRAKALAEVARSAHTEEGKERALIIIGELEKSNVLTLQRQQLLKGAKIDLLTGMGRDEQVLQEVQQYETTWPEENNELKRYRAVKNKILERRSGATAPHNRNNLESKTRGGQQ